MTKGVYTANQPLALGGQYYMWNRYAECQYLVHMTTAQFTKFGHQSRIELADKQGKPVMFVIDLLDRSFKPLNQVMLADPERTVTKLFKTLQALYGRAPQFKNVMNMLELAYSPILVADYAGPPRISLSDFNCALTNTLVSIILPELVIAYDPQVLPERPEHPSVWVAEMGKCLECSTYIGGGTAKNAYVRPDDFDLRGIVYRTQDWKARPYPRTSSSGPASNPMLSIIDALMYCEVEQVRELITSP